MFLLKAVLIVFALLCGLYLVCVTPRITGRPSKEPFLKVLYAHRGLHDNSSDAPENSMAAFKKAVEGGYGIECDVQLTKDGVPVIFHDFTLERVARDEKGASPEGKICDYTFEELQKFHLLDSDERIPRFEEFLKFVDGRVPLIIELKIELKDTSVCNAVDELLGSYRGVYCIESFNPLGVFWYRKNRPEVFRGQLSDEFHKDKPEEFKGILYVLLTNLLFNCLAKPDFIAFNHRYSENLSRRLCRKVFKTTAAAWTIKSQAELEHAKQYFDIFIFDSFIPKNGSASIR